MLVSDIVDLFDIASANNTSGKKSFSEFLKTVS